MSVWLTLDAGAATAAALDRGADALLLRMGPAEEGAARARARDAVCAFLAAHIARAERPRIFVEIAPLADAANLADLDALAFAAPDGVCLPQADGRAAIQQLSARLAVCEAQAGLREGAIQILARATQTPASVFGLGSYAGASARLVGLVFDAATPARATARDLLLLGARAAGVLALDAAVDATAGGLAAARRAGFDGAITENPDEIARIAPIFTR